jgi:hypothetical protein
MNENPLMRFAAACRLALSRDVIATRQPSCASNSAQCEPDTLAATNGVLSGEAEVHERSFRLNGPTLIE